MKKIITFALIVMLFLLTFMACSNDITLSSSAEPQQSVDAPPLQSSAPTPIPDDEQTPENNEYGIKFFRVPPMTDEQQTFYTDYVRKIMYTGLLLTDWSGDEYSSISAEPSGASDGSYLILAFEDITDEDEMQKLFQQYKGEFPAEMIEEVLLKYFPFTTEQLHEILSHHYNADMNTYHYVGGRGGGPSEAAIVNVSNESDGTVRLDYKFYTGYSGLNYPSDSYQYKTPGVVTMKPDGNGGYKFWSVDVGEEIEAPKAN